MSNADRDDASRLADAPEKPARDAEAARALHTQVLARADVVPQIAQRILRHADYHTTNKHYTVLA